MYSTTVLSVFLAALGLVGAQSDTIPVTGTLGNATAVTNNPVGLVYTATLPVKPFAHPDDPRGNVKGSVSATANPDGVGVHFEVNFSNLPTGGGPFLYHIHAAPVPEDGNCTKTLAHLDPFIRGEVPTCDASLPETCQVGDLSGKHGTITSDPFAASYSDDFASTVEGLGSFFGNRSITLHFSNKTRITCANFTLQGPPATGGSNVTTNTTTTTTGGPTQFTGAGSNNIASIFGVISAVGLAFLL